MSDQPTTPDPDAPTTGTAATTPAAPPPNRAPGDDPTPGAVDRPTDPAPADPPDPTPAGDDNDEERGSETSRLAVGYPTLSSGSVDTAVVELTTWLQREGVDVPITNTVTPDVMQAVVNYRRDRGIEDDAESIPGGERNRDNYIGPDTWAAMVKARD
jgi:hypothetical protein